MFYSKLRKTNIEEYQNAIKEYDSEVSLMRELCEALYLTRKESIEQIQDVSHLINSIANTPKSFKDDFAEIHVHVNKFKNVVEYVNEALKQAKISGGISGAGVAAGAGMAALGPSAAMAIATTFGTASTGTAIASLSGAAATNAALAWLGGGALAVKGGGMAAGKALLAMAGPIGWTIAGASIAVSGVFLSRKNKKIAEEAHDQTKKVIEAKNGMVITNKKIHEQNRLTISHKDSITQSLHRLQKYHGVDYSTINNDVKIQFGALVNNTKSLAKLLDMIIE